MASSIMEELNQLIQGAEYSEYVDLFDRSHPTTSEQLRDLRKTLNTKYHFETAKFYTRKGNPLPDGMYSLFGVYNDMSGAEVRESLVSWARDNRDLVEKAGTVMFAFDKKDFPWVDTHHLQ